MSYILAIGICTNIRLGGDDNNDDDDDDDDEHNITTSTTTTNYRYASLNDGDTF
jgi:hypothetical protein